MHYGKLLTDARLLQDCLNPQRAAFSEDAERISLSRQFRVQRPIERKLGICRDTQHSPYSGLSTYPVSTPASTPPSMHDGPFPSPH